MPADGDAPPMGAYLSAKTTLDYLEIPLLLKLGPSLAGGAIRPIFFVGPTVEFLLHASEVYDTDFREHMTSADAGFIVGGGAEFGRLSLDARYTLGLAPIVIDQIYDVIWRLTQAGRTILLVEENAARIADRATQVALLDNGQFAWTGQGAELMARPKILETYLGA